MIWSEAWKSGIGRTLLPELYQPLLNIPSVNLRMTLSVSDHVLLYKNKWDSSYHNGHPEWIQVVTHPYENGWVASQVKPEGSSLFLATCHPHQLWEVTTDKLKMPLLFGVQAAWLCTPTEEAQGNDIKKLPLQGWNLNYLGVVHAHMKPM
jgi:hypothetical protein